MTVMTKRDWLYTFVLGTLLWTLIALLLATVSGVLTGEWQWEHWLLGFLPTVSLGTPPAVQVGIWIGDLIGDRV